MTPDEYEEYQNSSSSTPAKGTREWAENDNRNTAQAVSTSPNAPAKGTAGWTEVSHNAEAPKGTEGWAEANSGENAPQVKASDEQAKGTVKAYEHQQAPTSTPSPSSTNVDTTSKTSLAKQPKMSYLEMYQKLNPYKVPTLEDLEREKKKQKRQAIFSAISDGIAALSNLYFTTQYAPNAYNPTEGMSVKMRQRWDKLKKESEENLRTYMEGYLRAAQMDEQQANNEWTKQHTIERDKVNDQYKWAAEQRAQAKADRDEAMAQLRMDLMQGKIDAQEAAARAKEIEADYAAAYWKSRINKNNYRAPIRYRSSGRGNSRPGEYPWYDKEGTLHYAHSYEAMRQNALHNGTWNEGYTSSTSTSTKQTASGKDKGTTKTTTTRPAKGHSTKPQTRGNVQKSGRSAKSTFSIHKKKAHN